MLAGIYYGSQYGGSTTSILMRIPGEAASVMTCIDGYAMSQKGRGGAALCIAAVGSFIAGTFGVIMLTLVAPPLGAFALRFGPPEYTALLVLGLVFLAYMSSTSLARTLLMAGRRPAAGLYRHRRDDRPFPLRLRHQGTGRRHRHRAGRGGPVRAWRNSLDTEQDRHRQGAFAQAARASAEPRRVAAIRHADRARLGAGLHHRHRAGLGAHHLQLPVLRRGKADFEASGAVRQGRGGGRRGSGIGEQRGLHRRRSCRCWRSACRPGR